MSESDETAVAGYVITRRIGRGGFAVVYEAEQVSIGRPVALKVLDLSELDEEAERRFRLECRSIGSLSWHRHVVAVHDAGFTADHRPYLAMELMPAGSLGARLRTGEAVPPDEVRRIGIEIADALAAAHDGGIVHRDVKPDNVLIGRGGEFMLSDFGIATLSDATQSATGSFSGTYAYCAPEVLRGGRATSASDVFALGALLFTATAGRPPFVVDRGDAPGTVVSRVLFDEPGPLPDATPADVRELILACLAKDPADRPSSAGAVRDLLRAGPGERSAGPVERPLAEDDQPQASDVDDGTVVRPTRPTPPPVPVPEAEVEPLIGTPADDAATLRRSPPVEVSPEVGHGDASTVEGPDPGPTRVKTPVVPSTTDEVEPGADGSPPRRRTWLLLLGALVVIAGIVAAATLLPSGSDGTEGSPPPSPSGPDLQEFAIIDVGSEPRGITASGDDVYVATMDGIDAISASGTRKPLNEKIGYEHVAIATGETSLYVAGRSLDGAPWVNEVGFDGRLLETWRVGQGASVPGVAASGGRATTLMWKRVAELADSGVTALGPALAHEPVAVAMSSSTVWVVVPGGGPRVIRYAAGDTLSGFDAAAEVAVGQGPTDLVVTSDGVWVSHRDSTVIERIDPSSMEVVARVDVGVPTDRIAANGSSVWAASRQDKSVIRIDRKTNEVDGRIDLDRRPEDLAVTSNGDVWVTNTQSATVVRLIS